MIMRRERLRIVVCGMIAADPHQGGATWAVLQYVLGLKKLGHDVLLLEPINAASLRPAGHSLSESMNARYFAEVASEFELSDQAALLVDGSQASFGLPHSAIEAFAKDADLLINISGMLTNSTFFEHIPTRAYLDLDPAFIQLWQSQGIDMRFGGHTHFVTIGMEIGTDSCRVPTCGVPWIKTLQPVELSRWPVAIDPPRHGFTTVGNWRGYGCVEHEGRVYGQRAHSMREIFALPTRTSEHLQVAVAIHPGETKDLEALDRFGWTRLDPHEVAGTPRAYRRFIQCSKGELGIPKSGYVLSRCGWFSDRSICYLASGRPVVAMSTGFEQTLPMGRGLFAFEDCDGAIDAFEAINGDYESHCQAAREIAEEHFSSERVLNRLLDSLSS